MILPVPGSNSFADGMMGQAFLAEAIFTFVFVLVVLGATNKETRNSRSRPCPALPHRCCAPAMSPSTAYYWI